MEMPTLNSICIVTPTYIGDIDQFSMLRRSINLFAPGFPHFAIVHTEDCLKFRKRFREEARLEIGLTPGWVRLNVGLEVAGDMARDIEQALDAA